MSGASPWHGLGSLRLNSSSRTAATSSAADDDGVDDFERGVQRTVPAAGAPSVIPSGAPVSAFDHPFRPAAGSAAKSADDSAASPKKEEPRMSEKPEGERAVRNIQVRICRAIEAAGGTLLRTDLAKALPDLEMKQISQGIFQVTANSRAQKHMTDTGWTLKLTRAGIAYLKDQGTSAAEPAAAPKKPTRRKPTKAAASAKAQRTPKAERKKPKARRGAIRVHRSAKAAPAASPLLAIEHASAQTLQVVQERSFRCGVFSDGAFHLAKNGQVIDLSPAEHAEMLRYLDRMAAEQSAAS